MNEETPPKVPATVPAEIHYGLQGEFIRLASAIGIEIKDGTTFVEALEQCHARARAAASRADQYDGVLSMLDGADDALEFAYNQATGQGARDDIRRAQQLFRRAIPLLRHLAGQ